MIISDSQYRETRACARTHTHTQKHTYLHGYVSTHSRTFVTISTSYSNVTKLCTLHTLCILTKNSNYSPKLAFVMEIQCVFCEVETELFKSGSTSGLKDIKQRRLLNRPSSICRMVRCSDIQLMLRPLLRLANFCLGEFF